MSDEEAPSRSGEKGGAADVEKTTSASAPRYNLRPRVTTEAPGRSHQTSPLYQLVNHGGLEVSSAELVASLKRTLALARGAPPVSGATMTDPHEGDEQRGKERVNPTEEAVRHSLPDETSPFELRTARVTRARQLPTVPPYDYSTRRFMSSDPGVRRVLGELPRVRLPFDFTRADIPFVPPVVRATDTLASAQAFATRMTAIEQARSRGMDVRQQAPTTTEDLSWIDYHRLHGQRLAEGERALTAIARTAADASNELDIHPDLHPRLEEGHATPYAGRSVPKSRSFEFQQQRPTALGRREFDIYIV